MLRGRRDAHHRLGFTVPFVFATVAALAQPFIGHVLGLRIADTQPAKLAAFELAVTTEWPAPLRFGGVLIDGEVRWALEIPRLGSIIARNSFDKPVHGLDTIPVRPAAGQHHPSGLPVDGRHRHAAGGWRRCCTGCCAGAVIDLLDNRGSFGSR